MARVKLEREWKDYEQLADGETKRTRGRGRTVTKTNFLFSQLMTIQPILANLEPDVTLRAIEEKDDLAVMFAGEGPHLIGRTFKRNKMTIKQASVVLQAMLFGVGNIVLGWDPKAHGGAGDMRIEAPDTRTIYKEPGTLHIGDSNMVFRTREMNMPSMLRAYPGHASAIRALFAKGLIEPEDTSETPTKAEFVDYQESAVDAGEARSNESRGYFYGDGKTSKPNTKQTITLVECWMVDESLKKHVVSGNKVKLSKKEADQAAYPEGRLVIFAGNHVFLDVENPLPGFPFFEVFNYIWPGKSHGVSEVKHVRDLQKQYDVRNDQLFDHMNMALAPVRLYDRRSGLRPDRLSNNPGTWSPVHDVQGVRQLDPPQLSAAHFASLDKLENNIEAIMGVREVTQGRHPGEIRSGTGVELLQNAAFSRLSIKSAFLEAALLGLVRFMILMIGQFYIPGIHYPEEFDFRGVHPDLFEIEVKAGSNLASTQMQQKLELQWMLDKGIISNKVYLEHSTLRDKQRVLKEMEPQWEAQQQQEQAILEAQMAQAQGQGGA
jgi:hypothetical protein